VIFDPLDYGSYYDLPTDGTVYQGQVAPQDAESVPIRYADIRPLHRD
jgi:hypothetical protein